MSGAGLVVSDLRAAIAEADVTGLTITRRERLAALYAARDAVLAFLSAPLRVGYCARCGFDLYANLSHSCRGDRCPACLAPDHFARECLASDGRRGL